MGELFSNMAFRNYINKFKSLDIKEITLYLLIATTPLVNDRGLATLEFGFTILPSYFFAMLGILFLVRDLVKQKNLKFWGSPIDKYLGLFLFIITISIWQSRLIKDISSSIICSSVSIYTRNILGRGISQVAAIFFMVGIYYFVINTIKDKKVLLRVITVLIITATCYALYGLLMYTLLKFRSFSTVSFFANMTGGLSPADFFQERGIRIRGVFMEPLMFGTYFVSVIPLTAMYFFIHKNTKFRLLILLFFIIQIVTSFLTISRGVWFGFVLESIVLLLLMRNRMKLIFTPKVFVSLAILVAAIFIALAATRSKSVPRITTAISKLTEYSFGQFDTVINLKTYTDKYQRIVNGDKNAATDISGLSWSTAIRINDMAAGLAMFQAHPILGIGWGNYIFYYQKYDPHLMGYWWYDTSKNSSGPGNPSCPNLFISILAETGILGIVSFLALMGSIIFYCLKKVYKNFDPNVDLILKAGIASICGVLICYQFFAMFYFVFIWILFGILMSAVLISERG